MARTSEEQRNLDLVLEMYREVLIRMDASKVDRYIAPPRKPWASRRKSRAPCCS